MNFIKSAIGFVKIDKVVYEHPLVNLNYCKSIRKTTNTINNIVLFQIVFVGCDATWSYENKTDLDKAYDELIDTFYDISNLQNHC